MKNDTFNQIINANLASIDLASPVRTRQGLPDLMKKVLNKQGFPDSTGTNQRSAMVPNTDRGSPFSYEGSSPDCHRARRPASEVLAIAVSGRTAPSALHSGQCGMGCPTRRPHTPTYAPTMAEFQSVVSSRFSGWRRRRHDLDRGRQRV